MESDEQLVQAANEGDAEAFESLYYRYRDWVYRLAFRFTRNREQALDVLQETFAYLLRKLPNLKLTASMTTFLYPVVKHVSITIGRKSRREKPIDEGLAELPSPAPEQAGASRAELAAVMGNLPEDQREIVLMRFVEDMSIDEIAAAIGIPAGTVKSRFYRALQTLRNDRRTRDYFLE